MKLLDEYKGKEKEIHEYFGYEEEWEMYPIDDCIKFYWTLKEDHVWFWDTLEEAKIGEEEYSCYILSDGVYVKEDYTMIKVDSQTDGNKLLAIFDNYKEVK